MSAKFHNKKGQLTRYALACGYVATFEHGEFSGRMDMPSPSAGVIRVIENGDAWRIAYQGKSLAAARRAYAALARFGGGK